MGRYRQPPKDIVQFTSATAKRVDNLERLPRGSNTSVDSGTFRIANIATFGKILLSDGSRPRGWILYDQHGQARLYTGGDPVLGNQFIEISDNSGNDIFSDDAASGQGLARPYIPWTAVPTAWVATMQASSTSTNFAVSADLYDFHAPKQHPFISVYYRVTTTAAATFEIMYFDNLAGLQVGSTVAWGASQNTFGTDKVPIVGGHMSAQEIVMRGRVASGSGTIAVTILSVHGVQT